MLGSFDRKSRVFVDRLENRSSYEICNQYAAFRIGQIATTCWHFLDFRQNTRGVISENLDRYAILQISR